MMSRSCVFIPSDTADSARGGNHPTAGFRINPLPEGQQTSEGANMPVSKHRHKLGGKSVRHPGRGKVPTIPPLTPDMLAWQKFRAAYTAPFFAAREGEEDAPYALDIIAARAWRYNAPMPVLSKAAMIREMANPLEDDYPSRTA